MSLNVSIFICLLVNFLFSCRGNEITARPKTIANIIKEDKNICNSTWNIQQSQYVQGCGKINFPDKRTDVTKNNTNQFLCLSLYDRYYKICQYNNPKKGIKIDDTSVINNQIEFDKAIKVMIGKGENTIIETCQNFQHSTPPAYSKTQPFITQFELSLKKILECINMCNDAENVNPLCAVLALIDHDIEKKTTKAIEENNKPIINNSTPDKLKVADNIAIKSTNEKLITPAAITTSKNKIQTQKNPHDNKSEIKSKNDSTKILLTNAKLNNTNDINKNNTSIQSPKLNLDKAKENVDKQIPKISKDLSTTPGKNIDDSTNAMKSVTLSEQTRIEELENQPQNSDEVQLIESENDGDFPMDDHVQNPPLKDISQIDEESNDQKNTIPRLSVGTQEEDDSHFFGYFTIIGFIGISSCILYHHKQKILAMIVEGRRSRGGRGRKRPSTASYRKLDCNLEEAVTSQCNSNVTHVIY